MSGSLPYLALAQGIYYVITGIWPLLSIRTFEAVTGPKTDDWLVQTVGVLVAVIGVVLILAGIRQELNLAIAVLAVGSAVGLTGIDVWYVARKVIPRIYLLDGVAEVLLIVAWVVLGWAGKR